MSNLKDIVYCSEEQLATMVSGTPVGDHAYDENDLYITPLDEDIIVGADGSGTKVNENNELVVDSNYVKDTVSPEITEVKEVAERAEVIARGRATGYVFDTLEDLDTALANEEFITSLVLGDNLYIRATDVPDYWWDGTQKQQLEAEKPDLSGLVKDVTVGGSSVVVDGVANIPKASATQLGAVKTNNAFGVLSASDGSLMLIESSEAQCKNGANQFAPISAKNQHWSTFYGLAKVAGVDERTSENPVGTYTNEAKIAIRDMLGAVSSTDVTTMINEALGVIENGSY